MWSRSELKARAKEVLNLNYWKIVLVSLILSFISGGGGSSATTTGSSTYTSSNSNGGYPSAHHGFNSEMVLSVLAFISIFIVIFLIVFAAALALSIFVFNPLSMGCYRFFILSRKQPASINEVTYAFSHSYKNIVKIMFLRNLYTFLWSLLFIIPGIIKGLEYRMIPYILAENPGISSNEAFALSKKMMDGEKWNAFVLDLSFWGWFLLGLFTCCILNIFYVNPYYYLTCAELYAVLKKKTDGMSDAASSVHVNSSGTFYTNPYQS